ncbi:MAG: hypothetical protein IJ147_03325 [Lachnospiraceae bacterium]|nr:hypothetical protein [Lachnospiraceae bacterium]
MRRREKGSKTSGGDQQQNQQRRPTARPAAETNSKTCSEDRGRRAGGLTVYAGKLYNCSGMFFLLEKHDVQSMIRGVFRNEF